MSFLRHVGKHGDRKIAVIFREVPNEEHMCLVTYTQLLNQNIHDPLMATIESDIGQESEQLADALNRQYTKSGDRILQVLHYGASRCRSASRRRCRPSFCPSSSASRRGRCSGSARSDC